MESNMDLVKRVRLTRAEKLMICQQHALNRSMGYKDLATWARGQFKLTKPPSKATIMRALREADTLSQLAPEDLEHKNTRSPIQLSIDQAVVEFVAFCELHDLSLTGAMIMEEATRIADRLRVPHNKRPRFGWAWLRHLELRHGFRWRRAYGEMSSTDMAAAAEELEKLRAVVSTYRPCDVFNMDETGFFYNAVPRGSICINRAPALKQSKERVTMALCANATGTEKVPILYVGKSKNPRWLPNKPAELQYDASAKAWMTTELYQKWLKEFDDGMRQQERHVLLLVDNASVHSEEGMDLTNVVVKKLPPNTTAKIQPMDQGIIYCVKRIVLAQKMRHALDNIHSDNSKPYKVGLLCAMKWCEEAWGKVSAKTIENCWHHSGLIDKASVNYILN